MQNYIFRYEDIISKVEMSMLEGNLIKNGNQSNLGKRLRLDYEQVDPKKIIKSTANCFLNYKNFDLKYSTWFDSIMKGIIFLFKHVGLGSGAPCSEILFFENKIKKLNYMYYQTNNFLRYLTKIYFIQFV